MQVPDQGRTGRCSAGNACNASLSFHAKLRIKLVYPSLLDQADIIREAVGRKPTISMALLLTDVKFNA